MTTPRYIPDDVLLALPCPTCGARRRSRCTSRNGRPHAARTRELEAAYRRGWFNAVKVQNGWDQQR